MIRFGNLVHALLALLCLLMVSHLKDPHLLHVREYETPLMLLVALTGMVVSLYLVHVRGWKQLPYMIAWLAVLGMIAGSEFKFRSQKQGILTASSENTHRLRILGQHLVVGYGNNDEISELVRRGFIAGLFVTRRNAKGKSLDQLRAELVRFQNMRREAGLAPLIVATDQEGGPVSRLSPPLARQASLASILTADVSSAQIELRAKAYGAEQAMALADLGVNINFSPVIDLKPSRESGALDFHTRIVERTIAAEPVTVARVGLAYSRGLLAQGVLPTVKHFPGLGGVLEDTHHFSAHLKLPLEELIERDWYPFRFILSQTPALLMVGHVIVNEVDPDFPASLSHKLMTGIVRENWKHDGILISDDMTMAAVYNRGLCQSSILSLNAGMDLLLVAYDWEKVYPVLDCLLRADESGKLKDLEDSRLRLGQLPWQRQDVIQTDLIRSSLK